MGKWVPLFLALFAAAATFLFVRLDENEAVPSAALIMTIAEARSFFALIATVSGTLLGFCIASLAILVSVGDSKLMNNMKKIGLYSPLIQKFYASVVTLFFTMTASIALFFYVYIYSMPIVVFLFVLAIGTMFLAGRAFFRLLEFLGEPTGDRNNID